MHAFGEQLTPTVAHTAGALVLEDAWGGKPLEPAPITRTDTEAVPFKLLSGTIRAAYTSHRSLDGMDSGIVVAPGILGGNTGKLGRRLPVCWWNDSLV